MNRETVVEALRSAFDSEAPAIESAVTVGRTPGDVVESDGDD